MQHTKVIDDKRVKQDIESFLDAFYKQQISRADLLHSSYKRLWEVMHKTHTAGGKRMRPYMMALAYDSHKGSDYPTIVPIAAALELLHTALLIHDDIIDRDYIRHGQPNVAGNYKKLYGEQSNLNHGNGHIAHLAHSSALLAGDLAISAAYQFIITSTLTVDKKQDALTFFGELIFVVAGGELLDSETTLLPFEATDPVTIAQLKTADYSFVGPLIMGAQLAEAPHSQKTLIRKFGLSLGIAFQLQDDLLGIFGDQRKTGKSTVSDLREQKRTHLMREAFTLTQKTQRERLHEIMKERGIGTKQLNEVRHILTVCGAKSSTEETIRSHRDQALAYLHLMNLDSEYITAFEKLVGQIINLDMSV